MSNGNRTTGWGEGGRVSCSALICCWLGLLGGCQATGSTPPSALAQPAARLQPAPHIAVELDFRPHTLWTAARMDKARQAARLMENVINSEAFARVLTGRNHMMQSEGLGGAEVLRLLRSGVTLAALRRGEFNTAPKIILPVAISPESGEFSHSNGFTDLATGIIYTQREWMDDESVCKLAGLYAHEYMHVLGFTHTEYYTPWRDRTVPYTVGHLVADLAETGAGAACVRP